MILIDFSQVMVAGLMAQIGGNPKMAINEDLVRHMILNSLRASVQKFKSHYGEVVICCDSRKYWRKEYFPNYKANRKRDRNKSKFDWVAIFDIMNKIKTEVSENLPYKYLEVPGAEADDIIATLVSNFANTQPIVIVSGDKDFIQLQSFPNVSQFSPIQGMIKDTNPENFLIEHIIRGDSGDGIPNILSADDTFVSPEGRQKPINSKRLREYKEQVVALRKDDVNVPLTLGKDILRNYLRNNKLINLLEVPQDIGITIMEAYHSAKTNPRGKLLSYFMEKKLKNLIGDIGDF